MARILPSIDDSSRFGVTGVPGSIALPMGVMLTSLTLPESVRLERTTPTFTAETVPPGLLRGHKVASGTWGRLRVHEGSVTFVLEESGEARRLGAGDTQVIEPDVVHHVVVDPGSTFAVEFHR